MKFKNHFNAHEFPKRHSANPLIADVNGEAIPMPSKTVPDQSLTVREIIQQYGQGIKPEALMHAVKYEDDRHVDYDNMPVPYDLGRMDLAEIEQLNADVKERMIALKKQVKEAQKRSTSKADSSTTSPDGQYPKKTPPEAPPAGPSETPTAKLKDSL